MRVFVAIPLPAQVREALGRVQGELTFGRAADTEQLHITLAFLGEQPDAAVEEAHHALATIRYPVFEAQVQGLGSFSAEVLWAGLRDPAPVAALHGKVASALHGAGLPLDRRRFRPHVTLARFDRPDPERLAAFIAVRDGFPSPPFEVYGFALYRSTLRRSGAVHEELARYPLAGAPPDFG